MLSGLPLLMFRFNIMGGFCAAAAQCRDMLVAWGNVGGCGVNQFHLDSSLSTC